jgi:hypothetical protein
MPKPGILVQIRFDYRASYSAYIGAAIDLKRYLVRMSVSYVIGAAENAGYEFTVGDLARPFKYQTFILKITELLGHEIRRQCAIITRRRPDGEEFAAVVSGVTACAAAR